MPSARLWSRLQVTESPTTKFVGYAGNAEATAKKIVRGAFEPGDCFVRSGDLLSVDQEAGAAPYPRMVSASSPAE